MASPERKKARPAARSRGVAPEKEAASSNWFPIAGVGASAGGIDAFVELLRHLPASPGMAFIYVLHQEAKHESSLSSVIARSSAMPVATIEERTAVQANHVYVAPPGCDVTIEDGVLHVEQRTSSPLLPIDSFLQSLADDQGPGAIGVILSGSASDGSLGARAIKAEGGVMFAQDESAKFPSMPRSAVATGAVDFVLSPQRIAAELLRLARQLPVTAGAQRLLESDLQKLFTTLRASHDIDFTYYKPSTIERRIRRRMAVHRVKNLQQYLAILQSKPSEVEDLYSDLLIRVTGFFRDPQVFEALQGEVFPKMLEGRRDDDAARVWVPGCATGEEVYSIAIALLESAEATAFRCPVQIFGTDISESAIERARSGLYPESIAAEISPERLRRYFTRVETGYRVSKTVRACCIFARQNVTNDPPFSKLDLISCRNVMIYLGAALQRKVISILHYALRPNGYLLLGSSETIAAHGELFEIVDRKAKIYRRKPGGRIADVDFNTNRLRAITDRPRIEDDFPQAGYSFRDADRILLSRYAPPGVLINDNLDILQFRGRTGAFLEPAQGTASFNLFKMLREGLLVDVRAAIQAAQKTNRPERREAVRVKIEGAQALVDIEVVPFVSSSGERLHLLLFEQVRAQEKKRPPTTAKGKAKAREDISEAAGLKRELNATREYLQSIIEEQEGMNEELRAANEEIQSSNEELQSTNEELETAKEELQSTNEELTTLNEELENRNQELAVLNNDLTNLFTSIDIPVVMLDAALRVRRFNPPAQRVMNLQPSDAGRSITDLDLKVTTGSLDQLITEVIESLEVRSVEVRGASGKSYTLRVRPYRTIDNKIDGAVLILVGESRRRNRS